MDKAKIVVDALYSQLNDLEYRCTTLRRVIALVEKDTNAFDLLFSVLPPEVIEIIKAQITDGSFVIRDVKKYADGPMGVQIEV